MRKNDILYIHITLNLFPFLAFLSSSESSFYRATRAFKSPEISSYTAFYIINLLITTIFFFVISTKLSSKNDVLPKIAITGKGISKVYFFTVTLAILANLNQVFLDLPALISSGSVLNYKSDIKRAGITIIPLASLGILASSTYGYLCNSLSITPIKKYLYILLCGLVLIRGIFLAERLAIFEIIIPLLFVRLSWVQFRNFLKIKILAMMIASTYLIFTIGEYFRSWQIYKSTPYLGYSDSNIFVFTFERIMAYYSSSYNNAAFASSQGLANLSEGYNTLRWFWNMPLFSNLWNSGDWFTSLYGNSWKYLFTYNPYVNDEQNLYGYIGYLYMDYGWFSIIFSASLGIFMGLIVNSYSKIGRISIFILPIFMIGVLESPRNLYWTHERALAAYLVAILLGILLNIKENRNENIRQL